MNVYSSFIHNTKKKPNPNAVQWVNDETNSGTFIPWSASQQ